MQSVNKFAYKVAVGRAQLRIGLSKRYCYLTVTQKRFIRYDRWTGEHQEITNERFSDSGWAQTCIVSFDLYAFQGCPHLQPKSKPSKPKFYCYKRFEQLEPKRKKLEVPGDYFVWMYNEPVLTEFKDIAIYMIGGAVESSLTSLQETSIRASNWVIRYNIDSKTWHNAP